MRHDYMSTMTQIMRFKAMPDKDGTPIRHIVISLIPVLAEYDKESFIANVLPLAMTHLLSQLRNPRDGSVGA